MTTSQTSIEIGTRDKSLDAWLQTEVSAAYDELKAEPSKGRTPEQVLASLKAETERQMKTTG